MGFDFLEKKNRQILQKTVEKAENDFKLNVIYGDTGMFFFFFFKI